MASINITTLIESLSVVQDDTLPSDHAIIACSIKSGCNLEYEQTLIRAKKLLAYEISQKKEKKVVKFGEIDIRLFKQQIGSHRLPDINTENIDIVKIGLRMRSIHIPRRQANEM